jgi:glycosyltransferase involved in cell wall biosynthesis
MTSQPTPRLWFDITTLALWQHRPAVGIVRTEREICRRLLDTHTTSVRFCFFNQRSPGFVEIGRDQILAMLAAVPAPATTDPDAGPSTSAKIEQWLQGISLRAIKRLPAPWRLGAKIFLANRRQQVLGLLGALRRRRGRGPGRATPPLASRPAGRTVHFSENDIYLSMGLDWDHKDLDWLYREKRARNFRCILFCYDLIPYRFPHLYSGDVSARFARYFVSLAWCADHVFCISENTRRDLLAFLDESHHTRRPPCTVIRLGCDASMPDAQRIGPAVKALLTQEFILYVSTVERRKNHEVLYRAYVRLVEAGVHNLPTLVFVGMRGWGVGDLLQDIRLDPRVAGKILLLDRTNDDELNALYAHCRFTVYPSLYEGWGLPIAEGMAHGKFCLASNASSIPEVGGALVETLDPWDLPAWTDRLAALFADPEEIDRLNARVKSDYRPPTWEQASAQLLETVRQLAHSGPDADGQ